MPLSLEERKKLGDESSMLVWYPRVKDLLPCPKTVIMTLSQQQVNHLFAACYEDDPKAINKSLELEIKKHAEKIGYPLFLRTDQASGKHDWDDTCYVKKEEDLMVHIRHLVAFHREADMFGGLTFKAFVFREFLHLNSGFKAFLGMPVSKERRYFVRDGKVVCHHCCSADTEILTEHGFKLFNKLSKEEKVFSLNPATNEIELIKPEKYISYQYKGKMVHIKNHNFDMLVTPEHNIPILKNNEIEFRKAQDMRYNYRIPRTGIWIGNNKHEIEIGGTIYSAEKFFEFFGYYLAEGNHSQADKKNQERIRIHQNKDSIIPIIKCLKHLGIEYTLSEKEGGRVTISIHKKKYVALAKFCNVGKSYEKFIPKNLKEYGPKYLRILLDAFIYGDGNKRHEPDFNSTIKIYWTSSKQLAQDISELILKVGSRPSIYQYHKKAPFTIRGKEYLTKHPVFTINECSSKPFVAGHPNGRSSGNIPFETIEYKGMVYCVTLPKNHIIYIKRNGKCTWTGNCYWPEDAILFYGRKPPADWKERLHALNLEVGDEKRILNAYAEKFGSVNPGFWSVDFAQDETGKWWLIDAARGEVSWHAAGCPLDPDPEPVMEKKETDWSDWLVEKGDEG